MIRPTRRGVAVLAVVGLGTALAAVSGPRALGAVVVPAVVALAAGVVQVVLTPAPDVTRAVPPDGPAEREGVVSLRFDADTPYPATVVDRPGDGATVVDGLPATTVVGGDEAVRYHVRFERRGEVAVGPVEVRHTDALGLVARRRPVGGTETVLVYPPVDPLPSAVVGRLRAGVAGVSRTERDEFEGLREYVRGDALRNLNWKASAKRDDLVVTEFAGTRPERAVTVAAGGTDGDEMARTAASVVAALHDAGVAVDLRTPGGEVAADPTERDRALAHLAVVEGGPVPDRGATVVVEADGTGASVRVDGETTSVGGRGATA
jgi:uncharacterized protein (DUF58 family)